MTLRHMGGLIVQTNGKGFVPDGDVRAAAIWEGAVDELLSLGYLQPRGHKGEVFSITREGYDAADLLKESTEQESSSKTIDTYFPARDPLRDGLRSRSW